MKSYALLKIWNSVLISRKLIFKSALFWSNCESLDDLKIEMNNTSQVFNIFSWLESTICSKTPIYLVSINE